MALDRASVIVPLTKRFADLDFETAYLVAAEICRLRRERGEKPVGRKIGYTNEAIWERYNVHQPIWDHVYAHTVTLATDNYAELSIAKMVAPRVEPEIAFGLCGPPPTDSADPEQIMESVEWIARAFEIIDCHYEGWRFSGPDSVIDFGHHAALIVGEPMRFEKRDISELVEAMRDCRVTLAVDDRVAEVGIGANALGHPALALARLAHIVASQPNAAPLALGEIVTTGSLTAPFPVSAGEIWRTETEGIDLPPLTLRVT